MKRGEVWTVAGGLDYVGKPRPAVIVQDDAFSDTASVAVCALTTTVLSASLARVAIEPSSANGLRSPSQIMADKVTSVPRAKLGRRIGRLSDADITRVDRALLIFLGLAH
ncbi:MAG TPA: type II toxin-antitoxin system PemK/MazF family toxin [Reyranella sp.]|nr:type II toxin-antitoxin system PemK/MazF family toxin [Reyranella sp.]